MILFPTRGRPWALKRFIDNYKVTGATLPVTVILDEDNQSAYEEEWKRAPAGWQLFINKDKRNLVKALNNAVAAFPDEEFYGIVADDLVPLTDEWDIQLASACKPHYIVWPDDGIWGAKHGKVELPTHVFMGGELVRALGWFSPPYTNRHCSDFIWKDIADSLGIGISKSDVVLEHQHWHLKPELYDVTYATQPSAAEGHKEYYDIYKGSAQFKADVARVKDKLGL